MGRMKFPSIAYGRCNRCGRNGEETADDTADAPDVSVEGTGIELIMFRGELMCRLCKETILDREDAEREVSFLRDAASFRGRAGFVKKII